jgi:hypothetical protein
MGYAPVMGLLERWDRHNQSLLEYADHRAGERSAPWSRWRIGAALGVFVVWLLLFDAARERWGGWALVAAYTVAIAVVVVAQVRRRRRRLAWEDERRRARPG